MTSYHTDQAEDSHLVQIPSPAGEPTRVIDVQLADYQIKPNPIAVETGTVPQFRVVNLGRSLTSSGCPTVMISRPSLNAFAITFEGRIFLTNN